MKTLMFAASLVLITTGLDAAPVRWTLAPTPVGGMYWPFGTLTGSVSGTFDFDWETGAYSDYRFEISGYPSELALMNNVITPSNSNMPYASVNSLTVYYDQTQSHLLTLWFDPVPVGSYGIPLSPELQSRSVLVSSGSAMYSFYASGSGIVSSVPEPVAGVLVLIGAASLCLFRPRKTRSALTGNVPKQ